MKKIIKIAVSFISALSVLSSVAFAAPVGNEAFKVEAEKLYDSQSSDGTKGLLQKSADLLLVKSNKSSAGVMEIQSLQKFCDGAMTFNGESKTGDYCVANLQGTKADYDITLCSGKMNLKLKDTYFQEYKNDAFFSYAIDYTGSANVGGGMKMQFKSEVTCDICVWGKIDRNKLEVRVWAPSSLPMTDLGYRRGGKKVTPTKEDKSSTSDGGTAKNGTSSGGTSSGGTSSGVTGKSKRCTFCNGTGYRTCLTCDGKGYTETYVTVPNYSGSSSGSRSGKVTKRCPNALCSGGRVRCSYCGGSGTK